MNLQNSPLITIVTVSYNEVSTIEQTILSVINQTYSACEYIIIDGGSVDGTVDIIKKYVSKITSWVSEPDKGIYDAMNKGILKAKGKWINFMNSGDCFYSNDVVSQLFLDKKYDDCCSVIYGDRISVYEKAKYLHKPSPLNDFPKRFPIFHQSTFISTPVMREIMYDTNLKICADYNFFYQKWKQGDNFTYVEKTISVCECENGASTLYKNDMKRIKEDMFIKYGRVNFLCKIVLVKVRFFSFIKILYSSVFPKSFERRKYLSLNRNPYMVKL